MEAFESRESDSRYQQLETTVLERFRDLPKGPLPTAVLVALTTGCEVKRTSTSFVGSSSPDPIETGAQTYCTEADKLKHHLAAERYYEGPNGSASITVAQDAEGNPIATVSVQTERGTQTITCD